MDRKRAVRQLQSAGVSVHRRGEGAHAPRFAGSLRRRGRLLRVFRALAFGLVVGFVLAPAARATCVGDCSASGVVAVTDVLKMVNVALGTAPVSAYPAGDASGDGQITVDEIVVAVNNVLGGCPAVPTETPTRPAPTLTATPVAGVVFRVGSATGSAGKTVSFDVTIGTAGQQVVGTLNEIAFDPSAPISANAFGKPDCTVNGSLGKDISGFSFLPSGCTAATCTRVRALIAGFNVNPFGPIPDGAVLYSCNVHISASATAGTKPLACPLDPNGGPTAFYTDQNKNDFVAGCVEGAINVGAPSA